MDVHPPKKVLIGIDPYPYQVESHEIWSYHVISSFFPMFDGKPRVFDCFFFKHRVPYSINRFIIVLPIEIDIRGIPYDVSNTPKQFYLVIHPITSLLLMANPTN